MDASLFLITDRPGRSAALADHLARMADVQVVGTEERWDRGARIAAVVCDLTLSRPPAVRCLQAFQARYGHARVPLICLLRSSDPNTIAEARAFGAVAWLPADALHLAVAAGGGDSGAPRPPARGAVLRPGLQRSAAGPQNQFQAGQDGGAPGTG